MSSPHCIVVQGHSVSPNADVLCMVNLNIPEEQCRNTQYVAQQILNQPNHLVIDGPFSILASEIPFSLRLYPYVQYAAFDIGHLYHQL